MRFITRQDLVPGAQLTPMSNEPELRYHNLMEAPNPLANSASDRLEGSVLAVNFYKIVADHFVQDTLGGFDLSRLDKLVAREIQLSVWYRAIYGNGILARLSGSVRAISPRYWWPVQEMGMDLGDALIIPFATRSALGAGSGLANFPDQALVSIVSREGRGQVFRTGYTGITLGPSFSAVGEIEAFELFGDGIPDFPAIQHLVDMLDKIIKASQRIIDRHSQPHIQVPASMVQYGEDGSPSLVLQEGGSIFPTNRDDKDVKYITLSVDGGHIQYTMQTLLSLLGATAKVPPSIFNLFPLARMESGVSIEALNRASNEKVSIWQDELERTFANLNIFAPRKEANDFDPTSRIASNPARQ